MLVQPMAWDGTFRPTSKAALALTISIALLPPPGQAAPSGQPPSPDTYHALVERHRAGHRDEAVQALSSWSTDDVRHVTRRARAGDARFRTAAIVLHTDLAYSLVAAGDREAFRVHLEAAESLLDRSLAEGFRSLWQLAAGLLSMRMRDPNQAQRCFERGLAISAGEPTLLVALGSSLEQQAALSARSPDLRERNLALHERQLLQRSRLARAVSLYEEALRSDPGQAEARLRLGRSQLDAGRVEAGLAHVEWVLRNSAEADLVYVAHLLTGRERERRGDSRAAAESYAKALAVEPGGQVAQIALSHVRSGSGDREGAEATLLAAIAPRESVRVDPWRGLDQGRDALLGAVLAVLLRTAAAS